MTYCQIIELEPLRRLAYTYRGRASGEKTLACAGVNSASADAVGKNIFTELDTVLRFTLTPEPARAGQMATRLVLEHSGFKGVQLMIVSLVMGAGWSKRLAVLQNTLAATPDRMAAEAA
jgi:uncharacterized protein YndB with AHSA1/START domain